MTNASDSEIHMASRDERDGDDWRERILNNDQCYLQKGDQL